MAQRFIQAPLPFQPAVFTLPAPYATGQGRVRQGATTVIDWTTVPFTSSTIPPGIYTLEMRTGTSGGAAATDDLAVGIAWLTIGDDTLSRRAINVSNDTTAANLGYITEAQAMGFAPGDEANAYARAANTFSWTGTAWGNANGSGIRVGSRVLQANVAGNPPVGIIDVAQGNAGLMPEASADTAEPPLLYWLSREVAGSLYNTTLATVTAAAAGKPQLVEYSGVLADAKADTTLSTVARVLRLSEGTRRFFADLLLDFPQSWFFLTDPPEVKSAANRELMIKFATAQRRIAGVSHRWAVGIATGGATRRTDELLSNPGYARVAERAGLRMARVLSV